MRMYDCILAKKAGRELNREEIEYIVDGFTDGSITDYQMSAFLMAGCLKGMTGEAYKNTHCRTDCRGARCPRGEDVGEGTWAYRGNHR